MNQHSYGRDPLPHRSAVVLVDLLLARGLSIADIAAAIHCQPRMINDARHGKALTDKYAVRLEKLAAETPKVEAAEKPEVFDERLQPRFGR
jgi:hypothetical protein